MAKAQPKALKAKLLATMLLRVVLAVAFLGTTTWFQVKQAPRELNLLPLYATVVILGLFTIFYAAALNWVKKLRLFTYIQVTLDIALVTFVVYVTGAVESYLQVLYLLVIIGSTIMLGRRGGYWAAGLSSAAYGALLVSDFYGFVSDSYKVYLQVSEHGWEEVFSTVFTNVLAFFTVAYLTGYLAQRSLRIEKRLEEKEVDLENLERLNRQIVENISSGILTLDEKRRITSFNRAAEQITGFRLRELYLRDVDEIFPGLLESGVTAPGMSVERRFRKSDGGRAHLGFSVSPGRGGDASVIVIFHDLTGLKDMEGQLRRAEKLKALGELSVGIAHEIRNPLASISGSIQVLKDQVKLEGDDLSLMEIVVRETERLNRLVTDFLLFARPAPTKRTAFNLSDVINEKVRMFKNSPEARGIEIESFLNDGISIEADPLQVGQVLWNLFLNAAHAMEGAGRLTITSSLRSGYEGVKGAVLKDGSPPGARSFVAIRIADTGKGIPQEHLGRVFDPFFSTKRSGTGLGLAIAARIVESHGGTIEVKSRVGRGTVFRVILPVAAAVQLIGPGLARGEEARERKVPGA